MGEVVIKADEISKLYKLGEVSSGTLASDLKRKWAKLRDKEDPLKKIGEINDREIKGNGDLVWALKDVSFSIKQGEVIGFVGRNGAGKSTLLKILSRITKPTSGRIGIRGRIASLLEVGTGFHPELTGRENIFLNGAILGMSKTEIRNKLDEIVDFSGVTRYIDTPVKRYSSGMYVRLAFAVAAHLEPEILIIDEVLSVGDAEFQKRCLGKIRDVSENDGRTVLFVSHDMNAISTLTQRAILMERGRINLIGKTSDVINSYLSFNSRKDPVYFGAPSDSQPQITRVELFTSLPNNHHVCLAPLAVEIDLHTPHALKGASLSFQVINNREQAICHVWTFDSERPMCRQKGAYQLRCEIPVSRIYMGDYTLKVYFSGPPGGPVYQIVEKACPFTVEMFEMEREFQWYPGTCTYLEDAEWDIQILDN